MIAPTYHEDRDVVRHGQGSPPGPSAVSGVQAAKQSVGRFVRGHPKTLTVAALAFGLSVGWLVKRANGNPS